MDKELVERLKHGIHVDNNAPSYKNAGGILGYTISVYCNNGNRKEQIFIDLEMKNSARILEQTAVHMMVRCVYYRHKPNGSEETIDTSVTGKKVTLTSRTEHSHVLEPHLVKPVVDEHYRITGTVKLAP